jgi:hypothetical protein
MVTNVLNTANSGEALVYRASVPSATTTTRRIWKFNANVVTTLTAGTYWIEFQVQSINTTGIFFPPVTILNTLSSPTWNSKQRNSTTWTNILDGGSQNPLAFPFNISGSITLSNKEFEFSSLISIFPNPATNTLTIKDTSKSSDVLVEVYDIAGRVVKSSKYNLNSDLNLDISSLNSGNYILKLNSEKGSTFKKFIKI